MLGSVATSFPDRMRRGYQGLKAAVQSELHEADGLNKWMNPFRGYQAQARGFASELRADPQNPELRARAFQLGVDPDKLVSGDWREQLEEGNFLTKGIQREGMANDPALQETLRAALETSARISAGAPQLPTWSMKGLTRDILTGAMDMGPAILTGLVTRSPKIASSVIGGQAYGPSYLEALQGMQLSHQQAQDRAAVFALAEFASEAIPLKTILSDAPKLRKIMDAAKQEGVQEGVTQVLQQGYDFLALDQDITAAEFLEGIAHSMVVGYGVGGSLAAITPGRPGDAPAATQESAQPAAEQEQPAEPTITPDVQFDPETGEIFDGLSPEIPLPQGALDEQYTEEARRQNAEQAERVQPEADGQVQNVSNPNIDSAAQAEVVVERDDLPAGFAAVNSGKRFHVRMDQTPDNFSQLSAFARKSGGRYVRTNGVRSFVFGKEENREKFIEITKGLAEQKAEKAATAGSQLELTAQPEVAPELEMPVPVAEAVDKMTDGSMTETGWTKFSDDTGTLSIPRAEMPQIKAEHRGAMVNFLKGRDIQSETLTVPADSLKPTQAEFSPEKVKQATEYEGGNRSILVSSDNYVVDGHHQWLAAKGGEIQVIKIDAPIEELLQTVAEFPSAGSSTETAEQKKPAGTARDQWAIPKSEWVDGLERTPAKHRAIIKHAIDLDLPVPEEVLNGYPTLKKYATEKALPIRQREANKRAARLAELSEIDVVDRTPAQMNESLRLQGYADVEAAGFDTTTMTETEVVEKLRELNATKFGKKESEADAPTKTNYSAQLMTYAKKAKSLKEVRQYAIDQFGKEVAAKLDNAAKKAWDYRNQSLRTKIRENDSMAVAVAKLGGINISWREDITGDTIDNKMVPGVGPVFTKTGTSPDDMGLLLFEEGYLTQAQYSDMDGRDAVYAGLSDELSGRGKVYRVDSQKALEDQLQALDDQYAAEMEALQAMRAAMYADIAAEHGAEAAELAKLYDDAADQTIDDLQQDIDYLNYKIQELDDARPEDQDDGISFDEATSRFERVRETGSEADREPAETETGEKRESQEFDLSAPTEESLQKRADDRARAEAVSQEQSRKAELRAQADSEAKDFVLSGSKAPSDVAASRGQNDMFVSTRGSGPKTASTQEATTAQREIKLLQDDLADVENRLDSLHKNYNAKLKAGETTRALATTYNARTAELAERRDSLKKEIKRLAPQNHNASDKSNEPVYSELQQRVVDDYKADLAKAGIDTTGMSLDQLHDEMDKLQGIDTRDPAQKFKSTDTARIEDFGEKISGAKKDAWQSYKDDMAQSKELDIASVPLSKSWPEPDYQRMIDEGADPWAVGFMRSARDEIPTKPKLPGRVKRWGQQVELLRSTAYSIIDGSVSTERVRVDLMRSGILTEWAGRIDLYMAVGHERSLKGVKLTAASYSMHNGINYKPPKVLWAIEKNSAATSMSNWPRQIVVAETKEKAIELFKTKVTELDAQPATSQIKFNIYSKRGEDKFYVGKKVGRNYIDLESFDDLKEARDYARDNIAALTAKLEKLKEVPAVRRDTNAPRVGVDMRNAQDVTPQMFSDAFGFRGVQFGNWVGNKRRQKDLNDAYDALMDMAAILEIPPKAISLNGELGLAFGARGSGGVDPAAAHYERGEIVINLTKKNGAGSLGHEWWHAVDNYFSRMRGKGSEYMTEALDVSLASRDSRYLATGQVRKEMIDAFGAVMKAIRSTALKARSSKLDAKRTKEYWTTDREMSARAFESYLISKIHDQNASNDYLANIVDQETWKVAESIGFELDDSYPYPTAGEIPQIRAAFDEFFGTVETKETDKGVAMYSVRSPNFYSALVRTVETAEGAPKKGSANQWKQWLDGRQRAGQIKGSERDWIGVDAWLDGRESTTREELARYVRANQVEVEDVVLGNSPVHPAGTFMEPDSGETKTLEAWRAELESVAELEGEDLDGILSDLEDVSGKPISDVDAVKYAPYQLPGGENYREVLLTLAPNSEKIAAAADEAGVSYRTMERLRSFKSDHFEQMNVLAHVRVNERSDAEGARVLFIEEIQSDWHQAGRVKGYRSPASLPQLSDTEYSEVRKAARSALEKNDFLGFDSVHDAFQVVAANSDWKESWDASDPDGAISEWREEFLRRRNSEDPILVPDAPMKATDEWAMLAFKRMVRWAAENGFSKVAWTTGEQQADRYDLSKRISEITYNPATKTLIASDMAGNGVVNKHGVEPEELAGIVGKSVADSLISQAENFQGGMTEYEVKKNFSGEYSIYAADGYVVEVDGVVGKRFATEELALEKAKTLSGAGRKSFKGSIPTVKGDGLKVGGEGMKGFYDKILPTAVGKWAKKFGGRIGESEFFGEFGDRDTGDFTAHSIEIIPEMREAALSGLPLFSANDQAGSLSVVELERTLRESVLGKEIGAAIDAGRVVLHDTPLQMPDQVPGSQAVTMPDGPIHLAADQLAVDTALPVLMHEAFHSGGKAFLGTSAWSKLNDRLESLYRQGKRSGGPMGAFWRAGRRRVEQAQAAGDTMSQERRIEEFGAYVIEEYESAPLTLRKWVDDLIGAIKAWLLKTFGRQVGEVTPAQLRSIAASAIRTQATTARTAPAMSVSASTKAAYETRIDELFSGAAVSRVGIKVLDSSDTLALLGYADLPVHASEAKIVDKDMNHHLKAEHWKKVPEWLENPVAVFDSDTVIGRLVLIAPETVNGAPVMMIIEPDIKHGGLDVHLLVNAFDKDGGKPPISRWVEQGLLRYIDEKQSPAFNRTSGLRLPRVNDQKRGRSKKVYTERDLVKYRKKPQFSVKKTQELAGEISQAIKEAPTASMMEKAGWKLQDYRSNGLYFLARNQLVEIGSKVLPTMKRYLAQAKRMDAYRNHLLSEKSVPADAWRKYATNNKAEAQKLADLMHDATIVGVDPAEAYSPLTDAKTVRDNIKVLKQKARDRSGEGTARWIEQIKQERNKLKQEANRLAASDDLYARWRRLSPEAQEIYVTVRDSYQEHQSEVLKALEQRIEENIASSKHRRALIDALRTQFENQRVQAPYFPLSRFGEYWVRVYESELEGAGYSFHMFETKGEQEQFMRSVKDESGMKVTHGKKLENFKDLTSVSAGFVSEVQLLLGQAGDGPTINKIKDEIYQLYLTSLPDLSVRKHFIHRGKIKGYSQDAIRNFSHFMFHGSYQLARLKYAHRLENLLQEMRDDIGGAGNEKEFDELLRQATGGDPMAAQRVFNVKAIEKDPDAATDFLNELQKRHEWAMNPKGSTTAQFLTSFGFVFFLGASPAAAMVNLTQTPMVALPVMGAKWGYAKASKELGRAMFDFFRGGRKDGSFTVSHVLTGEEAKAFEQLVDSGILDKTLGHDLAGMSEQGFKYNSAAHKVMNVFSYMFHHAERFNREITALASFRLARAAGASPLAAAQAAGEVTETSHFDYSSANKARLMHSDTARVLLLFRQFSLNMTYLLARGAHQAFKADKPEVRAEARRRMAGILGMTATFAGLSGLPMFWVVKFVMETLFDDEDEPFVFDAEFRKFLVDLTGSQTAGSILARGPVDVATGASLSTRVSLNNLWLREDNRDLEGQAAFQYWLEQVAGPIGGAASGAFRWGQLMDEGQYGRAFEALLPVFLKNAIKAHRFHEEGANTMRGDPLIEDMSNSDEILQLLGFMPTSLSERYEENSAVKRVEQRILDRRSKLLDRYALTSRLGDQEAVEETLEEIGKFNRANPEVGIRNSTIIQSMRSRANYSNRATGGIILNPNLMYLGEKYDFAK
ncbi:MAG: PLxRFG domain-containing protein [Gammaproteobacteria bacterium]|nr:PLxRFG domain-containing protein [Gammaproteobacteria bacterium]